MVYQNSMRLLNLGLAQGSNRYDQNRRVIGHMSEQKAIGFVRDAAKIMLQTSGWDLWAIAAMVK